MFFVVSYDCSDNRRRRRVSKVLLDYGYRVQYSVFEVELDERLFCEMHDRLHREIDESEDSIRIYRICERCLARTEVFGTSSLTNQERLFIV